MVQFEVLAEKLMSLKGVPGHLKPWMADFFRNNHRLRTMRGTEGPIGEPIGPIVADRKERTREASPSSSYESVSLILQHSDNEGYDEMLEKFPTINLNQL